MTTKTNTTNAEGHTPLPLARFHNPALAASFAARTIKASRIFMGSIDDDGENGEFWVVTMAEGERLLAAGYEELR